MSLAEISSGIVTSPGLYRMAASLYHADCCPTPSLSNSIAKTLIQQSPMHAWHAHPRLNPNYEDDGGSRRMDLGTIAHLLLIGQGREVVEIAADSYRTNAAKDLRDKALADGKCPVLLPDLNTAKAMVLAARQQLDAIKAARHFFDPEYGEGEVVGAWEEAGGVWCRSMYDWLPHDRRTFVDYKTVKGSVHPDGLGRTVAGMGYDQQLAFYKRGLAALEPETAGRIKPIIVFQEIEAPYGLCVVELDGEGTEIGEKKAANAIDVWRRCLKMDVWPGYPLEITRVTYPTYALGSWLEREAREGYEKADGRDPFAMLRPGVPGGMRLE